MKLTRPECRTAMAALYSAIEWELEFIQCHMDRGRSIDPKTTRKAGALVRRFRRLREKIGKHLSPGPAAKP